MKSFFHGTTADNLKAILRDGFSPDTDKIWTVSENGVYFWSPDKLAEMGECSEDEDDKRECGKRFAFDSATCGLAKAKDCRAVVFEVELDPEDLSEDTSCDNMEGAFVHYGHVSPDRIKAVWITEDMSLIRGYYIALMMERDMNNLEFSAVEKMVGKAFQKAEIYVEDMFQLEPLKFKRTKLAPVVSMAA
jgi:hypothetical protein